MAKMKSTSSGGGKFPHGGSGKMFGKGGAAAAKPGMTAKGDNGGSGGKFVAGGSGKMFGKGSAGPARAGHTAKSGQ